MTADTDFARTHGAGKSSADAAILIPPSRKTLENQARVGVRQHPRHADFNTSSTGEKAMRKLPATDHAVKTASTDDLLHLVAVMVKKAEREPETADLSLQHAKRAFDVIAERLT